MEEQPKTKKCYYELMGVKIDATQDEIKRAFKKLSLKYHPDKNRKNPEAAKQTFQEITEAYNCLCDEKERLWYDNNREKLLMNKDDMTHEDLQIQSFGFNIFEYFEDDIYEGFGDDAEGYYAVYKKAFSMIDYEEERTYKFQTKKEDYQCLPTFGDSKTAIEDVVKFYEAWQNFTTIKVFAWADQHDTRDGENRYEKRQMEQDNEKLRRKEKKTYIQTIKDLVATVKKVDPRRAQLIELEKKQQEQILLQRENNKGEKQKKKEREEKLREERKKKKEEEEQRKFLEAQKKREELLKAEQAKTVEKFTCKECGKEFETPKKLGDHKKSHKKDNQVDSKVYEELSQIIKNGGTLTKKQQKEFNKFEAQQKAEKERLKQKELAKKKDEEKKAQAVKDAEEEQLKQEQENDNEKGEGQQNGDKKKRKRNKKKKTGAAEQQEQKVDAEEEKKPWKPKGYSDDEEEEKEEVKQNGQQNDDQDDEEEEQQDDGWGEVSGSTKAKARIQKEVKKKQKAKQSDKRSDETKNIEDNYFASVDDNHLKKFDRKQEQKMKKKQQDEENDKYY